MLPRLIGCLFGRLQGSAASPAKASCRPVKMATGAALNSEGSPASFAILIGRLILATATQTLHQSPLKSQRSLTASKRFIPLSADQFYAVSPASCSFGGLSLDAPLR